METTRTRRSAPVHGMRAAAALCGVVLLGAQQASAASATSLTAATSPASAGHVASTQAKATGHAVLLTVVPSATAAHYRVREQLTFFALPSDAVGTTDSVSGAIELDAHGNVIAGTSRITVDLRTLHTDQSRRDQNVQSNVLETASYPYAAFVVQKAIGLPATLPTTGKRTFKLVGTLTVHGVTRPTTWTATATLGRQTITGTAATQFDMTTFNITPPRVGPVLSVQSTVKLDISVVLRHTTV
jgi:polyisoprenoid-binding protein YceI